MELSKAIDLFLGEQRATTALSYRYVLRDMMNHIGAARAVEDIAPHHLIEYHQVIKKRDYRMATRNKYVKTIKVLFNWLTKARIIRESPASVLRQEFDRKEIPREHAMSDTELRLILDYTRFSPRTDALVRFLADTGCRRGGAAGLKVADLDLSGRQANVTEKGDKERTVAYGETTRRALERWLKERPKDAGGYVFSKNGEPISSAAIAQIVRRVTLKVGGQSRGPHSLRHRKGHQLADAKIPPSVAATALGHSDPSITVKYYYPRDWDRARLALEELALEDTPPANIIPLKKVR